MQFERIFGIFSQSGFVDQRIPFSWIFNRQADDRLRHFLRFGQGIFKSFGHVLAGLENCAAVYKLSHPCELNPLYLCVASFFHICDDEETLLLRLAKIDPFYRAGIHHRRLVTFVHILWLVDVPHCHVIEFLILHQTAGQDQVIAKHHQSLAAKLRPFDGGVSGQHNWQGCIRFLQPAVDQIRYSRFDVRIDVRWVFRAHFEIRHQPRAGNPRHGDHLNG